MITEPEIRVNAFGQCRASDAALALVKSEGTLANWRALGIGPAWRKVNGRIYYDMTALKAFACGEQAQAA